MNNPTQSAARRLARGAASSFICKIAMVVLLVGAISLPGLGQSTFGSILGTVTYGSDAAIVGGKVTLTNLGTADKRTTDSDANGNYQFVNLQPGSYSVDFEKTGFGRLKRDSITVVVQAAVRVDAKLKVGDVAQTVNVDTAAPIIETQ